MLDIQSLSNISDEQFDIFAAQNTDILLQMGHFFHIVLISPFA